MFKRYFALVLSLLLVLSSFGVLAAEEDVMVVGLTTPLTGTDQLTGGYFLNGAKLAVEEINAAGGILGKKIVLHAEDEGSDQNTAINACQKLIQEGVVAIIGSYYSSNNMAVMSNVIDAGIVYYACGSNPAIAANGAPNVWQIRVTDNFTGPIMGKFAIEEVGVKNPAILYSTSSATTTFAENVQKYYQEAGIPVNPNNVYGAPDNETNFSALISQITDSDADGIMCMSNGNPWTIALSQQLDAIGYDLPKFGNNGFSNKVCMEIAGAASDGWYTIADYSSDILGELGFEMPQRVIDFEKKYRETYGAESVGYAAYAYDCAYLLKAACEAAGTTTDAAAINAAMELTDMQGADNYYKFYAEPWHVLSSYALITLNEEGNCHPLAMVSYR